MASLWSLVTAAKVISPTSNDDSLVQRHSLTRVGLCNYRHWAQGAQLLERLDHRRICCRDALLKLFDQSCRLGRITMTMAKKARDREDDSLSNRECWYSNHIGGLAFEKRTSKWDLFILLSHTILPDTTWYDVDKTSHIPAEDLPDAFSSSRRFASNWSRARLTASQGGKNNDRIGFSDRIGWAAGRQAVFTNNNSDPDPDPNYHFIVVFSVFESLSLCSIYYLLQMYAIISAYPYAELPTPNSRLWEENTNRSTFRPFHISDNSDTWLRDMCDCHCDRTNVALLTSKCSCDCHWCEVAQSDLTWQD